MPSSVVGGRTAQLSTAAWVEDIQCRVATAMNINAEFVNVEGRRKGFTGTNMRCWGTAAGVRFFAKIYLVDPYPIPPRFATPGEELASPEKPQRAVEEQITVEWNMVQEMRSLVGAHNIPAPLGCSIENRVLVFEEVSGLRLDRFVNWGWPHGQKMRSAVVALQMAGASLRALHDSSCQGYETIDLCEGVEALRGLMRKKEMESTPYARRALKVLESTRQNLTPRTSLRVPVALNHGDFSLPNLIWNSDRQHVWMIDFEFSSYRPILHDLCTLIATLRSQLLRPFTSPRIVQILEEAFWRGYGPVSEDIRTIVKGLSCAWLFYHTFPRISTLRERRGWAGGLKALVFKSLLQHIIIARILRVQRSQ